MSSNRTDIPDIPDYLRTDCERCFGLCCVALPFGKSADFAADKRSGEACRNLNEDYRCRIHTGLRDGGYKGCTVYECFGAGQRVSRETFGGRSWLDEPGSEQAKAMYDVLPIMHQLHEMLYYLYEVLRLDGAEALAAPVRQAVEETERLAGMDPKSLLALDVPVHRSKVNGLLLQASEIVRARAGKVIQGRPGKTLRIRGKDLIGVRLQGADLQGANLRGALMIACDLRNADLRGADLIGADLRDADLRGANLAESLFLTQLQVNGAKGDRTTRLPKLLRLPGHWL